MRVACSEETSISMNAKHVYSFVVKNTRFFGESDPMGSVSAGRTPRDPVGVR